HVGGQFNVKPGAFTEFVFEKAIEAGADAVIGTHSHIPQKFEWKKSVPCAYCLGNFNMNPRSYLAMPEILTDYGYALHLYVEEKRITKATFSMMKNYVDRDGQISSYPVDELYSSLKSEKAKKTALDRYDAILQIGSVGLPLCARRQQSAFPPSSLRTGSRLNSPSVIFTVAPKSA
ncbi:MAG: CapA family protein, partial [Clostridia bacterium]|nr:CapA family protein [Clostridia bacterium]